MSAPQNNAATPLTQRGRLVVVEGIDGSGKSTQLDLLRKWLVSQGYLVVFTEWNSAPIVKAITRRGKDRKLLSPRTFSLIHAADLASRVHAQLRPALDAGAIVLADRYVYTAYARDAVRGVDRAWLRHLYSFAPTPDLAFYFDVPLEEAILRIMIGRPDFKFYEAGLDLNLAPTPAESFRRFQGLIRGEYKRLVDEFSLIRIDATATLVDQQQQMREIVRPALAGLTHQPPPTPFATDQSAPGLDTLPLPHTGGARGEDSKIGAPFTNAQGLGE